MAYRSVRLRKGKPVLLRDPNGRLLAVVQYEGKYERSSRGPWWVKVDPQVHTQMIETHIPLEED